MDDASRATEAADPQQSGPDGQPELLPGLARQTARASRATGPRGGRGEADQPAASAPVARVLLDLSPAHLDRPFDYAVPERMSGDAVPGVRVKVRFAGQDVDGFLVERRDESDHPGRLTPLRRVVSPEPVLAPEVVELAGTVAGRYAGTRSDVLRLAVPPRHARTEREASPPAPPPGPDVAAAGRAWEGHRHGTELVGALAEGGTPRAVATLAPTTGWEDLLAHAVAATAASGRGALVCLPDGRDVARLDEALRRVLGEGRHATLTADSGPAVRYREFLAVARGARRIVIGTRGAAFAPVHDLGLVAIWDDGDDLHAEPRAPYPHTREVLLVRAEQQGAACLVAGFAQSVESAYLLRTGWAREVSPGRERVRELVRVDVAGDDQDLERDPHARSSRMPHRVHETIRAALRTGPVLVHTPRRGYAASLACERCRAPARCRACAGPLRLGGPADPPRCGWCGRPEPGWACPECGHRGLRAPVVGERRTAEELGRTFPGVRVRSSGGEHVLDRVEAGPAVVVATPGAEPVASGGYAAVVLLDTWLPLARTDLRTGEEALRRWLNAAALVTPGGRVVVVGDGSRPPVQALVRWNPGGFAEREIDERASAHLPPASRIAAITGPPSAVEDVVALLQLPPGGEVLGPVPEPTREDEPWVRAVVRVPRSHAVDLASALAEVQRVRSTRKLAAVRVRVDPPTL